MPKRKDIKKILVIGAGPIIIGQACEFDYSGTQACKALKDEGYKVILINSNPATIMTDPGVADKTYIEPISIIFFLNFFLSSALEIAFEFAPINSILYFFRIPFFSASIARLSAV